MTAFVYITIWSRRNGAHLVLTISPVELREDVVVRMYSIAPAGVNAHGNPHWVTVEEHKSLAEISGRYIGAIYVGKTIGWANDDEMLMEWMDENAAANNVDVREFLSFPHPQLLSSRRVHDARADHLSII